MKVNPCSILVGFFLIAGFVQAQAQIEIIEVEREIRTEITEIPAQPYNFAGDYDSTIDAETYNREMQVEQGSAVSWASHLTSISNSGDQLTINGRFILDLSQTANDSSWEIHGSTSINLTFFIPNNCHFQFEGSMVDVQEFYIAVGDYDSINATEYCDFDGNEEFFCTGSLAGGQYDQFIVVLNHVILTDGIDSDREEIEFQFTIAEDGVVGNEVVGWGGLKSYYK